MVVAVRISTPVKGRAPKLSMLELVTVVNNRYRNSKLRKKVLPQGFCYVCSRIDPGGVFRNQNSWLFQKGFFHACEHFPQAPQSTFIGEEIKIDLNRNETSTVTETVAPSISVTIKHERDSGRFGTPTRKPTVSSREPRYESERQTPTVKSARFPQITDNQYKRSTKSDKSRVQSELTLKARTLSSIELRSKEGRSRRSGPTKTAASAKESVSNYGTDRITVIPTAQDDEVTKSDDRSDISTNANDLDNTTTNTEKREGRTTVGGAISGDVTETTPYININKSDGLGSMYSVEPLIKEVVLLEEGRKGRKTTGRSGKEKYTDTDTEGDTWTDRPGSGHLRYHHRSDEDSVPDPGFEIPPTPSVEERLQIEREEQARKKLERKEIEREIALGNVFVDESVDGENVESISDDASLRLTEGRSIKSSKHQVRATLSSSSKRSFCRCPSETRETSFMKSTCLICGKGILYGNSRRSRESSLSQTEAVARSMHSPGTYSNKSRERMLNASKQLIKNNGKSVSDEDYMDLESIIYEDDGRYWSSDEDEYDTQYMTRSAMYRYKNAKPYPLVDPDLHKLVYIKALHEAHLNSFMRSDDDFDTLDKLRHPQVFSYFPLLPGSKRPNGEPDYLGLRPIDDNIQIKKGQFMKHIFGDVDFEKFYRKSHKKARKHSILDVTNTALIAQDRVSTEQSRSSPRTMANVPKEDERTSVSLKMRKPGVNFGKDD